MKASWKESIYLQREQLAHILRDPLSHLAEQCAEVWGNRKKLEHALIQNFTSVPHCTFLYCLDDKAIQICDNVGTGGIVPGHVDRDRSQRPYLKEVMPSWGFLLSDAYISIIEHRPMLTALQWIKQDSQVLGYLGADFNLRNLPVTSKLYDEPGYWRQVKGDPAIRGHLFKQRRIESQMDRNIDQVLTILEELLTDRGVFQCQIHFSSSQATIWSIDDPFRYRILDQEIFSDPDICLLFPVHTYPLNADIPQGEIAKILKILQSLRAADPTIYLRMASINIFNGMISLTFSCDGTHYMHYTEFLLKDTSFWF